MLEREEDSYFSLSLSNCGIIMEKMKIPNIYYYVARIIFLLDLRYSKITNFCVETLNRLRSCISKKYKNKTCIIVKIGKVVNVAKVGCSGIKNRETKGVCGQTGRFVTT